MSTRKINRSTESNIPRLAFIAVSLVAIALFLYRNISHKIAFENRDYLSAVVSTTLVELANDSREQSGLPALVSSPILEQIAQSKANDMAEKSYFAHNTPDGKTPWYWFESAGYKYLYAGENLAVDFDESFNVNDAWLNSPTHRANMMYPNFTEIGIAVAAGTYNGRDTTFVVQVFGTPAN